MSRRFIRHEKQKIGEVTKISAGEIEGFATETIKEIFKNMGTIQNLLKDLPITAQQEILKEIRSKTDAANNKGYHRQSEIIERKEWK